MGGCVWSQPDPQEQKFDPVHLLRQSSFTSLPLFTLNQRRCFAKVTRVVDGDTCHLVFFDEAHTPTKRSFRLEGIDCPEMKPRLSTPHRAEHQQAARLVQQVLQRWLLLDQGIVFVTFAKEEKFGRAMGRLVKKASCVLEAPGQDVTEWLLAQGLGAPYHGAKKENPSQKWLRACIARCETLLSMEEKFFRQACLLAQAEMREI